MASVTCNFIIRITEDSTSKYLFDSQVLVSDIALARRFSSQPLARRYLQRSSFSQYPHRAIPIHTCSKLPD